MSSGKTEPVSGAPWYPIRVGTDGRLEIVGPALTDAAALGKPVEIGGVYLATAPSVDDEDAVSLLMDSGGRAYIRNYQPGYSSGHLTGDGALKATPGVLHGLVIAGVGVAGSDLVQVRDGGSGGTIMLTVAFNASNQTIVVPLPGPMAFVTDIYVDVTISGGSIYITGIYE